MVNFPSISWDGGTDTERMSLRLSCFLKREESKMVKKDSKTGTFTVSYSKRHPITRQPVTRVRKGIKSKAGAAQLYNELVVVVNEVIRRRTTPIYPKVLEN